MKYLFWFNFGLAIFTAFLTLILGVVAFMYAWYLDDSRTSTGEFQSILGYMLFFACISASHFVAWQGLKPGRWWGLLPFAVALAGYAWGANYLAGLA